MNENVKLFTGITPLDFGAEIILDAAKGNVHRVVIIGETEDGSEFFSSSLSDGPEILWMLERAKLKLLQIVDEGVD